MNIVEDLQSNIPFIGYYQIKDLTICDAVIDYWKNANHTQGEIYSSEGIPVVNKKIKDSIDSTINIVSNCDNQMHQYFIALEACLNLYLKKYKFLNSIISPWKITEDVNIQYYPPGGGFKEWHCERVSPRLPYVNRVLVFMTYLNTINEKNKAGGTEWFYQKLKLPAVKGHTVIWPVDWMFTHKGIIAKKSEKYIITGWYNFIP